MSDNKPTKEDKNKEAVRELHKVIAQKPYLNVYEELVVDGEDCSVQAEVELVGALFREDIPTVITRVDDVPYTGENLSPERAYGIVYEHTWQFLKQALNPDLKLDVIQLADWDWREIEAVLDGIRYPDSD